MKKRILAMLMVCMLAFSLAACGGSDDAAATTESTTEETTDEEATEETDAAEEETEADTSENPWYEYSDMLTVCYYGVSDTDEVAVFVASDDMSFAVLGIADPETAESESFVGELTEDENGLLTITDETSGYTLTFEVIDNGDETFTLDMGDYGSLTITSCTQEEAFDMLDTLDEYTTPVS